MIILRYVWAGAAVVALLGAFKAGLWYKQVQWDRERAQQTLDASKYLERGYERIAGAQAVAQAVERRTTAALQEARSARQEPILCPPTGDVRDAVLIGLSDRVRHIRAAAAGQDPGSAVAPVHAASAP